MQRRLLAEGLGALLLAACVVGSGIMAQQLSGGNDALALLANTAATVAVLAVLISTLAPISGAHFNPAVTLTACVQRQISVRVALAYVVVQVLGCCAGALLAHTMFDLPVLQASQHVRTGIGQWLSEMVATAGLVLVIAFCRKADDAAWRVALWIGAAYWFTASTSFANPAITVARALTASFSGIRPADAPAFIAAQLVGALLGVLLARWLKGPAPANSTT
jgi:glycerol uptake facilitator-like aquaporin